MARSTMLPAISTEPSSRNSFKRSMYFAMSDSFSPRRDLSRDAGSLDFKPDHDVLLQWLGLLLSCGVALFSRLPSDRLLTLVELRNTLEPFSCNGRAVAVMNFLDLATCVHPTICQPYRP
jgi:hypothetical protein